MEDDDEVLNGAMALFDEPETEDNLEEAGTEPVAADGLSDIEDAPEADADSDLVGSAQSLFLEDDARENAANRLERRVQLQREAQTKIEFVRDKTDHPTTTKYLDQYEHILNSKDFGDISQTSDQEANELAARIDELYQGAAGSRSTGRKLGDAFMGRVQDMSIGAARMFDRDEELYHRMSEENRLTHPKAAGQIQDIRNVGDAAMFAGESVAENLPNLGTSVVGSTIGAAIGSIGGPVGAWIGGMIGAGIGTLASNYGEVVENQYAENGEVNYGWAWGEAGLYSALDMLGEGRVAARFARGIASPVVKSQAKALGRGVAKQALADVQKTAAREAFNTSWRKMAKNLAGDFLMEAVTEPIQSNVVTRWRRQAQTGSGFTEEERAAIERGEATEAGTVFWDVMNEAVAAGLSALGTGAVGGAMETASNRREVRQAQRILPKIDRALHNAEGARKIVENTAKDINFQKLDEFDQVMLLRKLINQGELDSIRRQTREARDAGDNRAVERLTKERRDIEVENVGIDQLLGEDAAMLQRAFNGLFDGDFETIPQDIKTRVNSEEMRNNVSDIQDEKGNVVGKAYTDESTGMQIQYDDASKTYKGLSLDPSRRIPNRTNRFDTLEEALDYVKNLDRLFQMRDVRSAERLQSPPCSSGFRSPASGGS